MRYLLLVFKKGKRAVDASDSSISSHEEDEKPVVLNNGRHRQVVLDKDIDKDIYESTCSVILETHGSDSKEEKGIF